ncbi:MAG TPA: (2Fe-2S)-binding protein [Actinomycetota bacterium]|nr:(2Fe-2S)-binding protein [Actinomycetota bacterium]
MAAIALGEGKPALSRSFRFHRPRGPFCLAGYCQQCPINVAGSGSSLACEVQSAGDAAQARPRVKRRSLDPLRAIGRFGERFPPWFYERPVGGRRFRQAYVRFLRRLTGALPLRRDLAAYGGPGQELECEVLVVGGGPAGIAAATEMAAAGRSTVMLEAARLGGSALSYPSLWADLQEQIDALKVRGVEAFERTICLGLYREENIAAAVQSNGGPLLIRFEALVVATGAYDRPLPYAGNDLPGTIGVRGFERLLTQVRPLRSLLIGVYAGPEEAERAISVARERRIGLAWLAGPAELPDVGVRSFPSTKLLRAPGKRRIKAVELEDAGWQTCDLLVVGFTQPTYEFQVMAGSRPTLEGEPSTIVPRGTPDVPMLVVGEAAGDSDPRRVAGSARTAARRWLAGDSPPQAPAARTLPDAVERHPDAFVCFCEDVRVRDIERAVDEGFGHAELVKRRTGVGTGPCQGKLCLAETAAVLRDRGVPPDLPTQRPPVRPVSLSALAASNAGGSSNG